AEDGIRDKLVTGVQTCALPISCFHALFRLSVPNGSRRPAVAVTVPARRTIAAGQDASKQAAPWRAIIVETKTSAMAANVAPLIQIGRASCREREGITARAGAV